MSEQIAFLDGIGPGPQGSRYRRSGVLRISEAPDYSTPEAVTARCVEAGTAENAGIQALVNNPIGEQFRQAVEAARARMAEPGWGAEMPPKGAEGSTEL